jgi:hypothetical protein
VALLVALALLGAGCTARDTGGAPGDGARSPASAPTDPTTALRERCLSAMPDDAPLEAVPLTGRSGGELEAARIGPARSRTVAVLLPQIGGICGWGRWATAAAAEGVTSLLVSPCGYGGTTCTPEEDADPLHEVAPAVARARDGLGARRVVLIGTSMGGSLTVMAVAAGADVDGWADVSGPSAWEGVELRTLAADLSGDGLVVMARSEGAAAVRSARGLARAGGVPFLEAASGHGWDLLVDPVEGSLTRIGRRLVQHAHGASGT